MKRLHSILRIIIIWTLVLMNAEGLGAASPVTQPELDVWPQAPQAYKFNEVRMPTPDLATGAVNLGIPLYTIQAEDLSIPLELRYRSNGIRVDDDPYPVGYGWTFTPSLRVTRTVLGHPDGKYEFVGDRTPSDIDHATAHRCMVSKSFLGKSPGLDAERDIFTINLAGISFNGILEDGVIKTPGHEEYKITAASDLSSITVTDPLGNIWTYSVIGAKWMTEDPVEWGLSSIKLASGRTVTFGWTSGAHGPFAGGAYHSYDAFYPNSTSTQCDYSQWNGDRNISQSPPASSLNLTGIIFPGRSVSFSYSGDKNPTTLNKIQVKAPSGNVIKEIAFAYGGQPTDKTMLNTLSFSGGEKWTFDYNPETFSTNDSQDYWGYYNRKGNRQCSAPTMRLTGPDFAPQGVNIDGSDRSPSEQYMKARILAGVTYPTGGRLKLEYEAHRFEPDSTNCYEVQLDSDPVLYFGGGLRLSSMTLSEGSDDTTPQRVEYRYGTDGTGLMHAKTVSRGGHDSLRTEYSYTEGQAQATATAMKTANVVGVVTGVKERFGDCSWETRADYTRVGTASPSLFRTQSIRSRRGTDASAWRTLKTYTWNDKSGTDADAKIFGTLASATDPAGIKTEWTWDSNGLYPIKQKTGNLLTSRAEWEPLVGVKSLTDPTGIKEEYLYDNAGRLSLVSLRGRRMTEYDYSIRSIIPHSPNSVTTKKNIGPSKSVGTKTIFDDLGRGNLLSAIYTTPADNKVTAAGDMSDRMVLYDGDGHMTVNGALEMSRFEGGYFNADGKPYYYLTDYQGNVVRVIDKYGVSRQAMEYYPYGEPWVEWDWTLADTYPTFNKNRFLYGGKERITQFGLGLYNFEARMYRAQLGRFSTPDKKALSTPWLSPFAYCACNPVNYKDPTGEVIETLWDVGNVLYDAGAAIYNHITGDHEAAKSNWIDAGMDFGAALLSGVPAGTSKVLKAGSNAAKGIDKAADVKKATDIASNAGAEHAKDLLRNGRSGRQARLKELCDDPKLGRADRGWIKQERNNLSRKKRTTIRNPRGKELAHPRGKEAAKGHSYRETILQLKSNHKLQHKNDNNGKKNKHRIN